MSEMNIIDLFSGAGGLSQGLEDAGFEVIFASDKDKNCAKTYKANLDDNPPFFQGDIRELDNERLLEFTGGKQVDGIIAGPPCQGFSIAGKRNSDDPRNNLVHEITRVVELLNPKFFLVENVKGLLSMNDGEAFEKVVKELSQAGEGYKINTEDNGRNAINFGVPQERERVFILGYRNDFHLQPSLPKGDKEKRVTVMEAIGDLPEIEAGEGSQEMEYTQEPENDYQEWAKNGCDKLHNHEAMQHTQRIIDRFKAIKNGQGVADVEDEHPQRKRDGRDSHQTFSQNHNRLHGDEPAPTIPAAFKINFIHPKQHRALTPREGARLQSFRDSFVFKGKRTRMSWEEGLEQYEQIGNAVPPLLAEAIGDKIRNDLGF